MNPQPYLLNEIQDELDAYLEQQRSEFAAISADLSPIVDYACDLIRGGKRFRALFCYWAWVGSSESAGSSLNSDGHPGIIKIAAALEMFHASALVHDDLIDQSDTRRSQPAAHKRFEALHQKSGWAGSPAKFGSSSALLLGDLLLAWSSDLFGHALLEAQSSEIEIACRDEFSKMRVEVMAGQYLDVLEENSASGRDIAEAVARSNRVMLYKTAKYSIEAPLLIGAAYAGASLSQRRALSAFAIPLGLAFQLRDDVLGVFGDPSVTGKPAGDDLREGKRTVLAALTREVLGENDAAQFDAMLSNGATSKDEIESLQKQIVESGALQKTETMIRELGNEALQALDSLSISDLAKSELRNLADLVMNRHS